MKLTKKEIMDIRSAAFYHYINGVDTSERLLSLIPEKKHSLAIEYYKYLTENRGRKSYTVDFRTSDGAGGFTFHGCTPEEAVAQAMYKLQNGAFGDYEKPENIVIERVHPETIFHNHFEDFLKWKEQQEVA